MHRLLPALTVTVILCLIPACSSTPPPSPAALEGNKIISALRDLSRMYDEKNPDGFMSMISERYPKRDAFTASIRSVFSRYEAVQFTVQSAKLVITVEDRGPTKASFNWESSWESRGGSILKNSGRSSFVFEPKGAKLISIEGKNPFLPQAFESREK